MKKSNSKRFTSFTRFRRFTRHASFLVFHFWGFDLVAIDSALHSASGNLIHFFKNIDVVRRNAAKFKFSELSFVTYSCKIGKCWNQIFFYRKPTRKNRAGEMGYVKYWFWSYDYWSPPCFKPKYPKWCKK